MTRTARVTAALPCALSERPPTPLPLIDAVLKTDDARINAALRVW